MAYNMTEKHTLEDTMPLYEYYCADCRATFEKLTPYAKADEQATCRQCQGSRVRRMVSVFAAHRGGDGEFNDGYHFSESSAGGGCACGGSCGCGGAN